MKGASKVIMGATLVMVVTLAIVLGLVLVLLAKLYCTLLLRRRRQFRHSSDGAARATTALAVSPVENNVLTHPPHAQNHSGTPRSFTPGVLEAPRSLFFPKATLESRKLHQILHIHTQQSNSSPQHIGLVKTSPTNLSPFASSSPNEVHIQINNASSTTNDHHGEPNFVYISNPIYDGVVETPFETPDSSPSRLETGSTPGSSSSEEDEVDENIGKMSASTPPLTPMKKLPAEASSVSLRSLGTSGSDSVSNNNVLSSSSSSGSPRTSPSW